jgi:hypothetical protein
VSHNAGFGVPDAGVAVSLARSWPNRPPLTTVTYSITNSLTIPDLGFRLAVQGTNVPDNLRSIIALPGAGPHPEVSTPVVPLVDVGMATNGITIDLRGKAALIQRGINNFCQKIAFAAQAGAAWAIIYNNTGGDARIPMGETDLTPIPAAMISQNDGEALRQILAQSGSAPAQLTIESTNYSFQVRETLQCEFVGVRVNTDHTARGDLRIVLTSPSGTRSFLQRVNLDTTPGPSDWTYYSVQHFYESSFGTWTLSILDEDVKGTGSILDASLIINGIPITDTDHDGLDDQWEMRFFKSLAYGPTDDPDLDGYTNAREQIMGSDPTTANVPLQMDLSLWDSRLARLSWASSTNTLYRVRVGPETAAPLALVTNVPGQFPETEWFVPYTDSPHQFFQLQAVPASSQ